MASGRTTLDDLLTRATGHRVGPGGRPPSPSGMMKASGFYHLLVDPFWTWCEHHAPRKQAVDEEGEYERAKMQRGIDFEESWVKHRFPEALTVRPAYGYDALVSTCKAMLEGVRVIHHPQLWLLPKEVYGQGDILVRDDGVPSDLGEYSYRVVEVKRSAKVKEYQALQAAAYHRIVSVLQGRTLDSFTIALPSGETPLAYKDYQQSLEGALNLWRSIRAGGVRPEPRSIDKTDSPWRVFGNSLLIEKMDLTLLPDVGPVSRRQIRERLGIEGIRDLHRFSLQDLTSKLGEEGTSVYFHAEAYRLERPVVPPGRTVKIPWGTRSFALDFETSDDVGPEIVQPPHAYLTGLWDYQEGRFVRFLAKGPKEEARMFRDMLDYVGTLDGVVVHTWTDYENRVILAAADRHPELAQRLRAFERACVDLKEGVKTQAYLPVPTYSIKKVAPGLGFEWRHKDFGAFDSMTSYWRWVGGAPDDIMAKPLDYHEDDVRAMVHIARALDGLTAA